MRAPSAGARRHLDELIVLDVSEPPPEVRLYLFAGTQHGPGSLPLERVSPADALRVKSRDFH